MTAWSEADDRNGTGAPPLVVGVDIGGTKTAVLVCDRHGNVQARDIAPTTVGRPELVVDSITSVVEAALREAGAVPGDVAAMGVGVPGRVDPAAGSVTLAVNLGWHDLPLGRGLEDRLGIRTVLENDVRAAALGLHRRRVFGDVESLAFLAIGTGISAGVVIDGTLHRGSTGLAGEIGHVVMDRDGPPCACGLNGCFEAIAAGPAIVKAGWGLGALVGTSPAARARTLAADATLPIGAEAIFAAAAEGDPTAEAVIERAGRAVAWGVELLALAYDVDRIVIGGGVSHAGEAFMAPVRRELERFREASALAHEILRPDLVQLLPPGADAGAWGAVTIARESLGLRPEAYGLGSESPALALQGREVGHA